MSGREPSTKMAADLQERHDLFASHCIPLLQGYTEAVLKAAAYAKHTETRF